MARDRVKSKGRRESGSFISLPHNIVNSDEFCKLSAISVKLLIDLFSQFKGKNNGDLCCSWTPMKKRGWRSKDTLFRAMSELESKGWIIRTRQGNRNKANLFAVTWRGIDECKGKLDLAPNPRPLNMWKLDPPPRLPGNSGTNAV